MIFAACQAIESQPSIPIPEIWNELREYERMPYAQRLIGRGIEKLRPKDAAAARLALYAIIDRATAQIAAKAEVHRMRAEISDSLAADRLAFDDSPEAERLRRFDLACGRGLARSLDSLIKLRRAPELVECPSSDISEPTSADGEAIESSASTNATIEPTVACENVTIEPTDPSENATIEPTDAWENMTNEATADCENVLSEEIDPQKSADRNRAGLVRMVALHGAKPLDWDDDSCRVAQESCAGGRTRPAWYEGDKLAGRLMNRAAPIKRLIIGTHKTRKVGDVAELVNAGSVTSVMGSPPDN